MKKEILYFAQKFPKKFSAYLAFVAIIILIILYKQTEQSLGVLFGIATILTGWYFNFQVSYYAGIETKQKQITSIYYSSFETFCLWMFLGQILFTGIFLGQHQDFFKITTMKEYCMVLIILYLIFVAIIIFGFRKGCKNRHDSGDFFMSIGVG